jgi:hypothetical protein
MEKFIAFGIWYKDCCGTVHEETENYYIVKAQGWTYDLAISKKGAMVFDTEEERDNWIRNQNFEYDPR